jgi:putative serine protease PepD
VALAGVVLLGAGAAVGVALDDDGGGATTSTPPAAIAPNASGGASRANVGAVYAATSRSVVSVRVQNGGSEASGTGFLVDGDGTIVTNAHVVGQSASAEVRLDAKGDAVPARVVGSDASSDLAVLRVDPSATAGIRPLELADSDSVRVGDSAIAIGYPLGLDRTATAGIISGVGRRITAPNGFEIDDAIQTDAPINPGNSGGPLLDARGRVIGVNSQIATAGGGGGNVGIGFAVSSNTVREVVPTLRSGGTVKHPYIGVSVGEGPGGAAVVQEVVPGGPAEEAGIRPGDVIQRVGSESIDAPDEVSSAVGRAKPGERLELQVERDGRQQTPSVEVGVRPQRTP